MSKSTVADLAKFEFQAWDASQPNPFATFEDWLLLAAPRFEALGAAYAIMVKTKEELVNDVARGDNHGRTRTDG